MANKIVIQTKRLILRSWIENDLEPFAQLNADERVMEYFPYRLNKEESDQMAKRMQAKIETEGWGCWAVSRLDTQKFIGFIGLNTVDKPTFPLHFAPCTEVGWRLAYESWGRGYATEGAEACLKYAFETLKLGEIVSFTAAQNRRSMAVMRKIGMHYHPAEDFNHPRISEGHWLRRHVLYRLKASEWQKMIIGKKDK
jgi:3-dehydroquinate dehydratase/shikimate dehydrogenase